MVPEKSVIIEALGSFVFVVKDNIVHKTSIKIGTKVGKYIEVIGKKIKANDKVVVDGQFLLNDKDKVKEIKISSGSN